MTSREQTQFKQSRLLLGPQWLEDGRLVYSIWAPYCEQLALALIQPKQETHQLERDAHGYFNITLDNVTPGQTYYLLANDQYIPDPLSRYQPEGIHGPSQFIDPVFEWRDHHWRGLPLTEYIIYELHVGTFTQQGTFEAIIPYLENLKTLGVTAIELMPVAQFPGQRNWGYDGALLYAAQNSYGGPYGLKRLINACHEHHLAVILDVVYNHFGPEGNYLAQLGPYFTNSHQTPWGDAINFDDQDNVHVRRLMIDNALMWLDHYHIDALRLDALHAIVDDSSRTFLQDLTQAVNTLRHKQKRWLYLIGESDSNNPQLLRSRSQGGAGLDAQWNDDFHHALHTLLTDEQQGYYQDFGQMRHLDKALTEGFIYSGQYSPFRGHYHGAPSKDIATQCFVVCAQNHDQVGNRAYGERLTALSDYEQLKVAALLVILSPNIPLIFMGEEYGETAPFLYFVAHSSDELNQAVYQGRKQEFARFGWGDDMPWPHDPCTFRRSQLNHYLKHRGPHKRLYQFYQKLMKIRRQFAILGVVDKHALHVNYDDAERILVQYRKTARHEALILVNLSLTKQTVILPQRQHAMNKIIDTGQKHWLGKDALAISHLSLETTKVTLPVYHASVFINDQPF